MATPTKRVSGKKVPPVSTENFTPSELVAHEILVGYSDLTPSVKRIMDSGLGEAGRLQAITLFQGSLGVHGHPMRNPVAAIEAGRLADAEAG